MKKSMILLTLGTAFLAASCCNRAGNTTETCTEAEDRTCGQHGQTCGETGDGNRACGEGRGSENGTCDHKTQTEMTHRSSAFLFESELPWQTPVEGLRRQIMGYDDHLMTVKIDFEAGCDGGGQHSHPHSQTSVVVSGVFEVTIDGATQTLKAGDGFYVAPNLTHGAVCIEAGRLIDAFSPLRQDFLK